MAGLQEAILNWPCAHFTLAPMPILQLQIEKCRPYKTLSIVTQVFEFEVNTNFLFILNQSILIKHLADTVVQKINDLFNSA